ncbi:hypothetical protein E2C01_080936 [Portunus trituberculatus]|uniref:Uncharacterized protein n=1 Tax=Portunus trituberculatus TaxID=210409 RepID=A0A5B7INJ7_PORTR|nr:hypothetical protein [Portunus trituberculatus]
MANTELDLDLPHKKIVWAGQSGYPATRYCCICSYSVRVKPSTACPNQVCSDCYTEGTFSCLQTEELRRTKDIPHHRPCGRPLLMPPTSRPTFNTANI